MSLVSTIEAMDHLSVLGNEMVHDLLLENHTIYEILQTLLSYQVREPKITIGHIDPEYAHKTRSLSVNGDSVLRGIFELQKTVGGHIFVDPEGRLHWLKTIGEDKGQQIRYRKNLVGITRDIDYTLLCNRVYVYGAGGGPDRVKLTDAGLDYEYIDDADSQSRWGGVYARVFVDKRITHPETLLGWARRLLEVYKDPVISYTIRSIDLSAYPGMEFEQLQVGSIVTVIDEELGIDVKLNVVSITHPDLHNPQEIEIQLASKVRDITDTITGVYDSQQLTDHTAVEVGAGQVVVKGEFTVMDWVTDGQTTIKGDAITAGTITANQLVKTQALITESAQIGAAVIDSASIKNLEAHQITGQIVNAQIANIDGAKIQDATITNAKIQDLQANKIKGQLIDAQIAEVDYAKIKNVEVTSAQIKSLSASKITGEVVNAQIANLDGAKIMDATISNAKIQTLDASKITGQVVDAQIANISFAKIKNVEIKDAQIQSVSANKITGQIVNTQIANIDGAKINNASISNAKIQSIEAHKITGQIADYQILNVDWAKIKNVQITSAQIGSISASKITTGYLDANISIGAGKITAGGVAIDSSGIMINNSISDQALRFKKGVVTASISADTDGSLRLTGNRIICHTSIQTPALVSGGQLLIRVGNYEDVVVDLSKYYSFKPYNSGYGNLGESGYRWDNIYANNIDVPTIDSTTVYATNVYATGQVGANVVYANNFLLGQGWASNNGNIGYQWHNDKLYLRVYYNGKWYYTDPLN